MVRDPTQAHRASCQLREVKTGATTKPSNADGFTAKTSGTNPLREELEVSGTPM